MASVVKPTTDRVGRCRFCAQRVSIANNDTLVDHNVSRQTPRRCFGSGAGPAVEPNK